MSEKKLYALAALAVVLLGLLAYWPALDNPFIADDYALLLGAEKAVQHGTALFEMPLGWRRLISHFFFTICFVLFGANPAPFYGANLFLHVVNSLLVVRLVRAVGGDWRAAVAAGLFFVAYERHQEPVFWIGTSHELLLALGVLATVFAFVRYRQSGRRAWYVLALAMFLFSLFTKESFLMIPPLLVLADWGVGQGSWSRLWRDRRAHAPFWLVTAVYVALMYAGPWPYPFGETQSGLTPHFFGVYLRSLNRLLLFVYLFLLLGAGAGLGALRTKLKEKPTLFFVGWLLVTIVPYSLILYEKQLSSRHRYIPSVATAALVGLLFALFWEHARTGGWRFGGVPLLVFCLMGNVVFTWRKDAQYLDRAAPTEQLIAALDANRAGARRPWVVVVYDFPYAPVIGRGAVRFRAVAPPDELLFRRSGRGKPAPPGSLVLRWEPTGKRLAIIPNPAPP